MLWSYFFMMLNPALLIVSLLVVAWQLYPTLASATRQDGISDDSSDTGGDDSDDEGGEPFDWDAPLDLPPGVYAPTQNPVAVPA